MKGIQHIKNGVSNENIEYINTKPTGMKTEEEIREILRVYKEDDRLYYNIATIFSNAPLALMQYGMISKINMMEEILGEELSRLPLKKI